MQYMLMINVDESAMPAGADETPMSPAFAAYTDALRKAGVMVGGDRLLSTRKARRVRVRDGKVQVLDGPFSETKEQLGGYYVIEVPSMEEAVEWARKCPGAEDGSVDVRPVWTIPG